MLISHTHKFIFIKTKKTAGSSIEKILLDKLDNNIVFGGMPFENIDPINVRECEHSGYQFISKNFPTEWKTYYKFCVERNPWDKVVSRYHWYKKELPKKAGNTFEEFVLGRKQHFFRNDWSLYAKQSPLVDNVIRYENLNEEFKKVCDIIGIDYQNELNVVKLKSKYRKENSYRQMYNDETKQVVYNAYKQTIDYFDYKF